MKGFFFKEPQINGAEMGIDLEEIVAIGARTVWPSIHNVEGLSVGVRLFHGEELLVTMRKEDLERLFKELGREE